MKFLIKSRYAEPEYIGDAQVWGSGPSPDLSLIEPLRDQMVDVEKNIKRFRTGFEDVDIQANGQLTPQEKEVLLETAKKLREKILLQYPEAKDNTSKTFWNTDRAKLILANDTNQVVYDTDENIEHSILHLNIIAGGFPSVSHSFEAAERNGNKFYVTSEEDFESKVLGETYGDKLEANAALFNLLKNKNLEPLIWISYVTSALNKGFGYSTSKSTFEQTFMDFIEGKHQKTAKKTAAKDFIKAYQEWTSDKDQLIGKAIIEAAIYHGIIQKNSAKQLFNSLTGTDLGMNSKEAYRKLMKAEYQAEYKQLYDKVKEILK